MGGSECIVYEYVTQGSQFFAELLSVLVPLLHGNGVFSRRITSPSFIAQLQLLFALGPTTSGSAANLTSCPNNSERRTATGAREITLVSALPSVFQGGGRELPFRRQRSAFDGRKSCNQTVLICDLSILKRNIEVASYKNFFCLLH